MCQGSPRGSWAQHPRAPDPGKQGLPRTHPHRARRKVSAASDKSRFADGATGAVFSLFFTVRDEDLTLPGFPPATRARGRDPRVASRPPRHDSPSCASAEITRPIAAARHCARREVTAGSSDAAFGRRGRGRRAAETSAWGGRDIAAGFHVCVSGLISPLFWRLLVCAALGACCCCLSCFFFLLFFFLFFLFSFLFLFSLFLFCFFFLFACLLFIIFY